MRGKLKSYDLNRVLTEAKQLRDAGVKELLIISQDTSAYGIDTKYKEITWQDQQIKTKFYDLCAELSKLGIWVRLHYVYPYPHVDDIIPLMRDGLLLPYLDIPIQHASRRILKAMKRPASSDDTLQRIIKWREICPNITLRSTFIVGFPGETEEEFNELLEFLKAARLDRVGCFKYSDVEGASANDLPDHVPEEVKEERFHRFMQLQAEISAEKLREKVGTTQDIIIDEITAEEVIGRTQGDAPEIDGLVFLNPNPDLKVGEVYQATIYDSSEYDLFAEV